MTTPASELHDALLQAMITFGIALLCTFLFRRYGKRYYLWWSVAWLLYVLRIGAIVAFLATDRQGWLFIHQVLTGWTALALLWAAMSFSRQSRWRWPYLAIAAFPVVWSYVAIYRLDNFLLAAGPAVAFLSFATLWTSWVFLGHWRRTRSRGAALLAIVLAAWGLHHLDYPILRAQGAWVPWGYYLDILFVLATGAGILLLVLEDLHRGLGTLLLLSGDLQPRRVGDDVIDALLARPLNLAGVRGSALFLGTLDDGRFARGVGSCAAWTNERPTGALREAIGRALGRGRPVVVRGEPDERQERPRPDGGRGYAATLPVFRGEAAVGVLVIAGDERDPFAALGDEFLLGLGRQVGAALEHAHLWARLEARSRDLEQLSAHAVQRHEDERRRVSLALHDETAQVFAAVKMQLGLLRESASPAMSSRLDRVLALVDEGIGSIRSVTSDLRPPLLDDLGLVPALRALTATVAAQTGLEITLDEPAALPPLPAGTDLALFRALQEALSNVVRHAAATRVRVSLGTDADGALALVVRDDGRGLTRVDRERVIGTGHIGIAGMRERVAGIGGTVELSNGPAGGAVVRVRVPLGGAGATPPARAAATAGDGAR